MRKMLVLLSVFILVACQQKQEPGSQYQGPVGTMPSMSDTKMLEEVVRKDPRNVDALIKLGNVNMDTHRFQEAIDAYQKALELDPKNVDVRVDMGTCYRNIGRADRAVEEYRKAIEINPRHINAHKNLGIVFAFDLKDRAGAVKAIERYLELAPNDPDAGRFRQMVADLKAGK